MFYVKGGTKTQRELTENVAMFAIKKLFPKIRKYFILIRLDKFNDCFEYDERDYVINIDKKQDRDDFITAIFHELVHVKQYLKMKWIIILSKRLLIIICYHKSKKLIQFKRSY